MKLKNRKYSVTFLIDKSNDWINKYLKKSFLKDYKFNFKISKNFKKIKNQDIVFILNYTKILPKSFLIQNRLNLVVHASNLPKGKGFAPIQWQILNNKKNILLCLIEAVERVDSGSIIEKKSIKFKGHELNGEIRHIQGNETIKIIKKFLNKYPKFKRKKQSGKSTFFRKRKPEDSELNINKSLKKNFNLLRIVDNEKYPAFFNYKKKKYIIKIIKSNN